MAEAITFRNARMETGKLIIDIPMDQRGAVMKFLRTKKDRPYDLTIKEHREKRSLDATDGMTRPPSTRNSGNSSGNTYKANIPTGTKRNFTTERIKNMAKKTPHRQLVLEWLQAHGSITAADAINRFPKDNKCYRLAARISELRKAGYNIITDNKDKDGNLVNYAIYRLVKETSSC